MPSLAAGPAERSRLVAYLFLVRAALYAVVGSIGLFLNEQSAAGRVAGLTVLAALILLPAVGLRVGWRPTLLLTGYADVIAAFLIWWVLGVDPLVTLLAIMLAVITISLLLDGRAGLVLTAFAVGLELIKVPIAALGALGSEVSVALPIMRAGTIVAAYVSARLIADHLNRSRRSMEDAQHSYRALIAEREKEKAQRASEERFRRAFVDSATPFVITDLNGTLTEVNGALCAMLDYSIDDLVGEPWVKIISPDDAKSLFRVTRRALRGDPPSFHAEVQLVARRGTRITCLLDGSVLSDRNGRPERFFALAHDLTEQRSIESKLRESEERYRTFFERIPVALYQTEPGGTIVDANRALAELLGAESVEDLIGRNAGDFYPSAEERQRVTEMLLDEGVVVAESMLRRLDGAPIWVRDTTRVMEREAGPFFEGALADVTARRRVEEELRVRAQQQEAVATLSQAALASADLEATLDRSVAVVAAVLGTTTTAVLERSTDATFVLRAQRGWEGDADPVTRSLGSRTLASPTPIVLRTEEEVRFAAPELGARGLHSGVSVAIPGGDESFGVLWAFCSRDRVFSPDDVNFLVSAANVLAAAALRHRARIRLEELVRSKDELIASVSHELRTPLTVVAGMAQELNERLDVFSPEEASELIELMVDQSRDMSDLIEDLLVAARADIGKVTVRVGPVDVGAAVRRVLGSLRPRERVRVTESWDGPADPPDALALADAVRLRQVVRNLVTNALRYGGDEIRVVVSPQESSVAVRVSDNGPGIPEQDRERIFEPYHVAHDSAGQPSSVGLGLTVSRKLAELMSGSLEYRHDGGTVFELTLPRVVESVAIGLVDESKVRL
jgi:PAS domain S-box-containing protein